MGVEISHSSARCWPVQNQTYWEKAWHFYICNFSIMIPSNCTPPPLLWKTPVSLLLRLTKYFESSKMYLHSSWVSRLMLVKSIFVASDMHESAQRPTSLILPFLSTFVAHHPGNLGPDFINKEKYLSRTDVVQPLIFCAGSSLKELVEPYRCSSTISLVCRFKLKRSGWTTKMQFNHYSGAPVYAENNWLNRVDAVQPCLIHSLNLVPGVWVRVLSIVQTLHGLDIVEKNCLIF